MVLHLIISVDYEIFGNGKGNPKRHMIKPAYRMMEIAEKHGAKMTFMAEVMEYLVYSRYEREAERDFGYSPAGLIEKQMREAISRGHDVQMHIHPQFWKAEYSHRRIIPVPGRDPRYMNEKESLEMMKDGMAGMERMLDGRSPSALRLSNMPWVEAPENTVSAMEKLGIGIHSLATSSSRGNRAPGYWKLGDKVLEVPIFSVPAQGLSYFSPRRMFALSYLFLHTGFPSGKSRGSAVAQGGERSSKLDMCKLSRRSMISHVNLMKKYADGRDPVPIVMIGHTKDFFNSSNFGKFLGDFRDEYVSTGRGVFSTFTELEEILAVKGAYP